MRFIEMRIYIKDDEQGRIEELAEIIKDNIYDYDEEINPISDVTYEFKEIA